MLTLARRRRQSDCFDRYALDLRCGCLLFDGNEIALRPKIFAVLQSLADRRLA